MYSLIQRYNLNKMISQYGFLGLNFVVFQSIWALSVIGKEAWIGWSLALLLLHFSLSPNRKSDLRLLLIVTFVGIIADSTLIFFDVLVFKSQDYMPIWLIILWSAFALTLNYSLNWLIQLNVIIKSALGAVAGTFSYWMGHNLGAVDFTYSTVMSCVLLAISWGLVLPIVCCFAKKRA